jgi:hypothetical protein
MGDKTKNKNGEKRKEKKILTQIITFYKKKRKPTSNIEKVPRSKNGTKKVIFKKVRRQKKEAKTFRLFVLKCNAAKKTKAKHNSRF